MARARKQPSATTEGSELKCPECGKTFARAAALGAHRSRAHGVAGASSRRASGKTIRATASTNGRTRSARATSRAVDRDGLLQQLFPNGIPARESVLRRANAWLDEAEKLAALK